MHTDDYRFYTSEGSEAYCSPVDIPSTAYTPLYHADLSHPHHASGSSSGSWASAAAEYKPSDHIGVGIVGGLDHYSPYEPVVINQAAAGPSGVINYSDLDFGSYDSLGAFSSIPGEGMTDNPYI
jgi:hypothetical protein